MAIDERPQLKETSDILQSLGVLPDGSKAPRRRRGSLSFAQLPEEPPETQDSEPEKTEEKPAEQRVSAAELKKQLTGIMDTEPKPRGRRGRKPAAVAEAPAEKKPLDEASAEPEIIAEDEAPQETPATEPFTEVQEYNFEDFGDAPKSDLPDEKAMQEAEELLNRLEAEEMHRRAEDERRRLEEEHRIAEETRLKMQAEEETLRREEEERQHLLEDENVLGAFMERISNEFESKFQEKYSQPLPEKPKVQHKPEPIAKAEEIPFEPQEESGSWFEQITPKEPSPEKIDSEAALFVEKFVEDTKAEEEELSESFKETLTEKFLRERERYLRELNIRPDDEPDNEEAPAAPEEERQEGNTHNRRRLDFRIQPEMHQPGGNLQAVTYGNNAKIHELDFDYDDRLFDSYEAAVPEELTPPRPKTAEERLMDLAAGLPDPPPQPKPKTKPTPPPEPAMPSKSAEKQRPVKIKRPLPRAARAFLTVAVVVGLAFVGALVWQQVSGDGESINILGRFFTSEEAEQPESIPEASNPNSPLKIYESRDYTTTQTHADIMVMRANVRLRNFHVTNYLNIEETASPGSLVLDSVTVDGAIYFKTTELDKLELRNVRAGRIIINNDKKPVELIITGNSDIQTIEVKSPASIRQLDLAETAPGVQNIVTQSSGKALDLRLEGLELNTLVTEGESGINFVMTNANTVSAHGGLSVHGTGRIVNLAVDDDVPLNVLVKGVSVTTMNVKAAGTLNLSTNVDVMSVAKPVTIGGGGEIGSLTVASQQEDATNLNVDLAGISIQLVTTQTPSRISLTGSAQVSTLIANAPAYVMGNKVGILQVNDDSVIYENEPDRITTGMGVRPPQSVAQNPNIDYGAPITREAPAVVTDDVTTLCGHGSEAGGFLAGSGSVDDPYQIATAEQLAHITLHPSSHYIQVGDIDIANNSSYAAGFEMLCGNGTAFSGSYDGYGYTIANLRIASLKENVGLFAENIGTIRNVSIISGDIASTATTRAYVGGIVGLNYGNGTVEGCMNGAKISARNLSYTGGIAGYNFGGKIRDCYNTARITGGAFAGGITGASRQDATVARSYNVGVIDSATVAGALVGQNNAAVVTNCYYLEGTAEAGIGDGEGTSFVRTSEELASAQTVADLAAGNDNSRWQRGDESYKFPVLIMPETEAAR